ncbi:siderophore salmochelin receptor IroN [Massilia terrae]|uniref:TonB-dependent receptor n=1 Tax=Massilia terrae TaxID=1811224 RepID=A0ABT2D4A3_9BURK|nr:TonB-dependent receptor [Massilia terrae]MCS0661083.1 TonB-dependent receptor [Massilia terrae]
MTKLLPIACLALLGAGGAALAQDQAAAPPRQEDQAKPAAQDDAAARRRVQAQAKQASPKQAATADGQIQQVTVTGSRADDTETRRNSTASKLVYGREELDRNGDSNLGEVLKRLPGVTMGGPPGRGGGGIRMRGLGNGYTQMLVNGERPPPGFSLESIPPDQVERIEIMRGPVAEHSTQAIAGTINVILREGYRQKDVQLRLADNIEQGRHGANVSVTVPGKVGSLTWMLNASLMQNRQHTDADSTDADLLANGTVQRMQYIHSYGDGRSRGMHLSPRLSYKFDNGDTLNFQPFVVVNRNDGVYDATVNQTAGLVPPEFVFQRAISHSSGTMARGFGDWVHKMEDGARLDVKFSGGVNHNDSDSLRNNFDGSGKLERFYTDIDTTRQHSFSSGGKYSRPLGEGHHFAAGWDGEVARLAQVHVAEGDNDPLYDASGANLAADTRRLAFFAQDEWDITTQWSGYFGLRWEGIRTTSDNLGYAVKNTSSVFSPVLHTVYRIPGHDRDQVRASLTRSYKAPALNDLIAAPSFSSDNRATRPDRSGNPNLKPELAKGLDLAYEHYLTRSGILSASAFVRDIDNLMRRQTTLQQTALGPRWVSTPMNIGHARTSGVELEAKFQLVELYPNGPDVDLRTNYSRFWSSVDGIPGPYNRLDQQARQTANFGVDYRMKAVPLTVGGNFNWTPLTLVQSSVAELDTSGMKRQLDLYGVWKFSANTQLRVSGNNLFARRYESGRVVQTAGLVQALDTLTRTYTTLGLRLELKI